MKQINLPLENEAIFRSVFEQAAIGIVLLTPDGRLMQPNQKFCHLVGYSEAELRSRHFQDIIHPDDVAQYFACIQQLATAEVASLNITNRYICQDNSVILTNTIISPIRDASGVTQLYSAMVQDVTQGFAAQSDLQSYSATTDSIVLLDALRQSQQQYQTLVNSINGIVWEADPQTLDFTFVSSQAESILGYPLQSWLEPNFWLNHLHHDDRDWAVNLCLKATGAQQDHKLEYRMIAADGRTVWIEDRVKIAIENHQTVKLLGLMLDITAHKQAEAKLQQQEHFLRSIYEGVEQSIFVVDVLEDGDFRFAGINPAHERLIGISNTELQGKTPEEIRPPQAAADVRECYQNCIEAGIQIAYEECLPFQGRETYWLTSLTPLKDERGHVYRIVGTSIDITEHQQAEEQAKQIQRFLDSIVENIPNMIFVKDAKDLRFLRFNKAGEELLGYAREELLGKNDYDFFPTDEADFFISKDREVLTTKGVLDIAEEPIQTREQGIRILHTKKIPIFDEAGDPKYLLGISEDITARKTAEVALQESEEKFRQLTENLSQVFYIHDAESFEILYISPAFETIWEIPCSRVYQNPYIWMETVHPEDRDYLTHKVETRTEQISFSNEYRIIRPSGEIRWIRASNFPVYDELGRLYRIAGIAEDISDRKRAEAALQQLNEELERRVQERTAQLQLALSAARMSNWEWDIATNIKHWSSGVYALLGLHKDEQGRILDQNQVEISLLPTYELMVSYVHPEDREKIKQAHQQALEQRSPYECEFRLIWPDGSVHWCYARGAYIYDEQEHPIKLTGVSMDVTQRKQAEIQLQKQAQTEHLLAAIAQSINQSVKLDRVLNDVLERIRQFLAVDRVVVYRFEPDWSGAIALEAISAPELSLLGRIIQDPCFNREWAERYRQGYITVINDTYSGSVTPCHAEFLTQLQVKANLVVPILQAEQIWGLLIAHQCNAPRQWQTFEIELLKQLGLHIGIASQKANLYTELERQLAQKEVLLKEIHHRVKNNLQVISAMLKLQARTTKDPITLSVLEDSRSRLSAIALIHEILYQSNNLEQLDFHDYIQRLINAILAANSNRHKPIDFIHKLQPTCLNLETAIPCGLLLNELVTNAIKHAFPDGRRGQVCITLEQTGQLSDEQFSQKQIEVATSEMNSMEKTSGQSPCRYVLIVQDNGIGIPQDMDMENLKSLGLKIAYDLAMQLRGILELDRTNGTRFQLTFSELEYRKRF